MSRTSDLSESTFLRASAWAVAVIGVTLLVAGCSARPACTPSNCPGCCTEADTCESGGSFGACGVLGATCTSCTPGFSCQLGACVPPLSGSGSGGSSGSGGGGATTGGGAGTGGGGGGSTTTGGGSATGGGSQTGGGSPTGGGAATGGGGPMNRPPSVTRFEASSALGPSGSVTLSADVADPDGLGNLSGGTLHVVSTGQNLGAFSGAVGSYSFSLRWSALPNMLLTFPAGGGSIELEARFYDAASAVATRRLTLQLTCYDVSLAACTGQCVDLQRSLTDCGRCGQAVPSGGSCTQGVVVCNGTICGSECVDSLARASRHCGRCNNDCEAWATSEGLDPIYAYCSGGQCAGEKLTSTLPVTCSSVCSGLGLVCRNNVDACYRGTATQYGGCIERYGGCPLPNAQVTCGETVRDAGCTWFTVHCSCQSP